PHADPFQEQEHAVSRARDHRQRRALAGRRQHRVRALGRRGVTGARRTAHLALSDGTIFPGFAFGAEGNTTGEVVFTTGMTGYQEVLTDPSYTGQIVTMTAPQIGNTGINPEDPES